MFDFLKRLFAPQREDFKIDMPGVQFSVNHRLRVVFLYDMDSSMRDDRYDALEAHLAKRKYFLQVIVASAGMPMPPMNEKI